MIEKTSFHKNHPDLRLTPQRLVILKILEETPGHLTPTDIYQLASQRLPGITEATVYRTLGFLAANGLALATIAPNGHLTYEDANRDHHHLVCRQCGTTIEISAECVDALYKQFAAETGFRVDSSHITFYGTCAACQ